MNLADAQQMATDVLLQERSDPALHYSQRGPVLAQIGTPAPTVPIKGSPFYYSVEAKIDGLRFRSANYDLLAIIYGRLTATDQTRFLAFLLQKLTSADAFVRLDVPILQAGQAKSCNSETPLLAEFFTRQGQADILIAGLKAVPHTPGLTLLLLQLRTIIAWDFRRFTFAQLGQLSAEAAALAGVTRETARADLETRRKGPPRPPFSMRSQQQSFTPSDPVSANTWTHVLAEVPEVADVIVEQCREARFLCIQDSLIEGANLEVNQDKIRVADYVQRLGFPDDLAASLTEAENLYQEASSGFEYKSSMGHLRTFLENLHIEVCRKVHARSGGVLPGRWGETHEYLQANGILSQKEKLFVIPFYTLLSDEGVHPVQTSKDYARLLRNICIEYGLLLLKKVDAWTGQ